MGLFLTFIQGFAQLIEYVGIVIVAIASVVALGRLLWDFGVANFSSAKVIRREFAEWILTGLEFIIAAEIILVTMLTGQQELILLGAVVVIRILLGYAILKEIV